MTIQFDPAALIHSARERAIMRIPEGLAAQEETVLLILLATALEEGISTEARLSTMLNEWAAEKAEWEASRASMSEMWQAEGRSFQNREDVSIAMSERLTKALKKAQAKVGKLEAKIEQKVQHGHEDDDLIATQDARIKELEAKVAELVYADTAPKTEGF